MGSRQPRIFDAAFALASCWPNRAQSWAHFFLHKSRFSSSNKRIFSGNLIPGHQHAATSAAKRIFTWESVTASRSAAGIRMKLNYWGVILKFRLKAASLRTRSNVCWIGGMQKRQHLSFESVLTLAGPALRNFRCHSQGCKSNDWRNAGAAYPVRERLPWTRIWFEHLGRVLIMLSLTSCAICNAKIMGRNFIKLWGK